MNDATVRAVKHLRKRHAATNRCEELQRPNRNDVEPRHILRKDSKKRILYFSFFLLVMDR